MLRTQDRRERDTEFLFELGIGCVRVTDSCRPKPEKPARATILAGACRLPWSLGDEPAHGASQVSRGAVERILRPPVLSVFKPLCPMNPGGS